MNKQRTRAHRTKEQISKIMKKIKSKNSTMELLLAEYMWREGLRYRKHYKIIGKPDFAFPRIRLAVFCDSEFWHGYNWKENKEKFKSRRRYWHPKIERNMARDAVVNTALAQRGWTVLRFWGEQVTTNPTLCAKKVLKASGKLLQNALEIDSTEIP